MATLQEILVDEATAKEFFPQETPEAARAYLQGKGVEITREELEKWRPRPKNCRPAN